MSHFFTRQPWIVVIPTAHGVSKHTWADTLQRPLVVLFYQHRNKNDIFSSFMFRCRIFIPLVQPVSRPDASNLKRINKMHQCLTVCSHVILPSVLEQESDSKNIKYQNIYK